jgi:predicted metal-dependent enzyme (double-stranded beta helix superfamily)
MIWLFLLALQVDPESFDAVTAAPKSHRVLLEDDAVRVLRVEVAPGQVEPIHDHRWPSVMYFQQPQPITYIVYKLVNGRPVEVEHMDAPAFEAGKTVRGEPEGLHAVRNRGSKPFVAIRIEFKKGAAPVVEPPKP